MHAGPDGHFHECVSVDYSAGDIWGSTWYTKLWRERQVGTLEGTPTVGSVQSLRWGIGTNGRTKG